MELTLDQTAILNTVRAYVSDLFQKDATGHDWYHIYRVTEMAKRIARDERANEYLVEMIALLHELDDYKLFEGSNNCKKYLNSIGLENHEISFLVNACNEISFKGNGSDTTPSSLEAQIVQDADRLDAIGAIGVARTFAYGGKKSQPIYDPDIKPRKHESFEEYKNTDTTTINHFYEKLLLLKDLMNTNTGRKLAKERHLFIKDFLDQFLKEWDAVNI